MNAAAKTNNSSNTKANAQSETSAKSRRSSMTRAGIAAAGGGGLARSGPGAAGAPCQSKQNCGGSRPVLAGRRAARYFHFHAVRGRRAAG